MRIIEGTEQFDTGCETAVVIGKFDGMHLGHQRLIRALREDADAIGAEAGMRGASGANAAEAAGIPQTVVFTFDPSPAVFFSGQAQPALFTKEEKRRTFAAMGVDILVEFPMNAQTASMRAEDFIRNVLFGMLHARHVVAGTDLSFGYRGEGNTALLAERAAACGFTTRLIEKVTYGGRVISSTYVREEVTAGRMEEACALLGAPYSLFGRVAHGRQLGRTMGIPTVNLTPQENKCLPPNGVYYADVAVGDRVYHGVSNIGVKPTVKDDGVTNVETFLFDFDGDLYGQEIEVRLLSHTRPERAFEGIDALRSQIEQDIAGARAFFGKES